MLHCYRMRPSANSSRALPKALQQAQGQWRLPYNSRAAKGHNWGRAVAVERKAAGNSYQQKRATIAEVRALKETIRDLRAENKLLKAELAALKQPPKRKAG